MNSFSNAHLCRSQSSSSSPVVASGLLLVCTSMFLIFTRVLIREPSPRHTVAKVACTATRSSLLAAAASFAGVKEMAKQCAVLDKEIQQFYFEDYIHSEKE